MEQQTKEELAVRIPRNLSGRALRGAIGLGLLYIARGRQAPAVGVGPTSTYRIKLDATAQKYLPVASRVCGGEREAITAALSWLQHAPGWLLSGSDPSSQTDPFPGDNDAVCTEAVELENR